LPQPLPQFLYNIFMAERVELKLDYFLSEDQKRIKASLEKITPYLKSKTFIIVGGLAIRHYAVVYNLNYPCKPLNDIDFITQSLSITIDPKITEKFLIYHHHPDVYLALVDPELKLKYDIFAFPPYPLDPNTVSINNTNFLLCNPANQLVKTIIDCQRVVDGSFPLDPKQIEDLKLLNQIADQQKSQRYWQQNKPENSSDNLSAVIADTLQAAKDHPERLKSDPFAKPDPYKCPECIDSDDFPLTPMQDILKILGKIE
jgi:hypothetical protein